MLRQPEAAVGGVSTNNAIQAAAINLSGGTNFGLQLAVSDVPTSTYDYPDGPVP